MSRNRTQGITLAAVLTTIALVLTACGGSGKPPVPIFTSASGCVIAAFGSGTPGSNDQSAVQELGDARYVGVTELVNYASMNGSSFDAEKQYLDTALRMHIGIDFSVKDVLGDKDLDEPNTDLHRRLYGKSTHAMVDSVLWRFAAHSAVKRILISDELPGTPDDLQQWLPHLKERYSQVKAIVPDKPVLIVLYWSGDDKKSEPFYGAVKTVADDFAIDYYPYPSTLRMKPTVITTIGQKLKRVAGSHGWFVLQAFGWGSVNHPEGVKMGYAAKKYTPPNAKQMVDMAKRAITAGARNLILYSLADPNRAKLDDMKAAVKEIRKWWRCKSS